MPQLDHVTYFSQYFWLCVFFFGFYALCVKYYLPGLSRLAKYRGDLEKNEGSLESYSNPNTFWDAFLNKSLNDGLSTKAPKIDDALNVAFNFSSFFDSLKGLNPKSSLSQGFSWRKGSQWQNGIEPFVKEFKHKKITEDKRFASLVSKNTRDSSISGQTALFGGLKSTSTKSADLNAFDAFVFYDLVHDFRSLDKFKA